MRTIKKTLATLGCFIVGLILALVLSLTAIVILLVNLIIPG